MSKITNEEFQRKLLDVHKAEVVTSATYINARTKLLFSCINSHTWLATPANVTKANGTGCPVCAPRKLSLSQEVFQQNLFKTHEGFITCNDVYVNKRTKLTFICADNHSWRAEPGNVLNGEEGCPICNKLINPVRPYYLHDNCYLLSINNKNTFFYKIGISSNVNKRLLATQKELVGYKVDLVHVVSGNSSVVTELERKILASYILEASPTKFGGYTEVLSASNNKESLIEDMNSIL